MYIFIYYRIQSTLDIVNNICSSLLFTISRDAA